MKTSETSMPVRPAFLKPGDKVAVITPSCYLKDTTVKKACKVIRSWGFVPVLSANATSKPDTLTPGTSYYGPTAQQRAEDILWALHDDEIKALICTRGGYGAISLLQKIPLGEYAAHPKWMVGFSDISTLLSAEVMAGVQCIHGAMGSTFATTGGKDDSAMALRSTLLGWLPAYDVPAHPENIPGHAEGILVGGNISTFAALAGTEYDFTSKDGIILFIEEVEENMHAIDRWFNVLMLHGLMDRVKGIILGQFTECPPDMNFLSNEQLIASYARPYGIPVCCGFQAGHDKVNLPLIMGAEVSMDVTEDGARIETIPEAWSEEESGRISGQGDIMKVYTIENREDSLILRMPCNNIPRELVGEPLYGELARKMVATVTSPEQDGVGIAGPQVGLLRRVVAVQRLDKEGEPFEVYPNIRITALRGKREAGPEGCLSIPGKRGEVMRYRDIDIRYTSPVTLCDTLERVTGFTAVIFQHECDHLDGILYTDKAVTVNDVER